MTDIEQKQQHFVNLYRQVWGSNIGLDSKRIASLTEKELDERIDSLSRIKDMKL